MPEKCRVVVCGFDPMLVKAYAAANMRACWWHIPDALYEEFDMKPGMKVSGKLLKIYSGKTGEEEAAPDETFEWECAKETGRVVLLPSDVITKFKLTEFHFIEMNIDKIDGKDVAPGKEVQSKNWWPDDKMKLDFVLDYIE
ncbi:MAG: hypothetical protein LJE87_06005 [Deltaproteobacteria bacterium]|nr:hypothetical protein [Deltaproteobacteria bacterium]